MNPHSYTISEREALADLRDFLDHCLGTGEFDFDTIVRTLDHDAQGIGHRDPTFVRRTAGYRLPGATSSEPRGHGVVQTNAVADWAELVIMLGAKAPELRPLLSESMSAVEDVVSYGTSAEVAWTVRRLFVRWAAVYLALKAADAQGVSDALSSDVF